MYIDFRLRPPYGKYKEKMFNDLDSREYFANKFGFTSPQSVVNKSMNSLLEEMDRAQVKMAVVPGRGAFGIDSMELIAMAKEYPGKFIIFPFLNPLQENSIESEIEELLHYDCVRGFVVEPGLPPEGSEGYLFDDERAFPMYEILQSKQVPLMITFSGHTVPMLDSGHVTRLDRIAAMFPDLRLVLAHAGFPWIMECIGMAFRRRNVYLLPDGYGTNSPGTNLFVEAANTIIPDQILFGTAYPIIPLTDTVNYYVYKAGYRKDVLEKIMFRNAESLLA